MSEKQIYVEREQYELKGKEYFAYFIKGQIRGKDVKISVKPHDYNGYTVLDILFDVQDKAELVVKPYEIVDQASGNVIKGNTFFAVVTDVDGTVYECPIKHNRTSDKALINMLVR